MRKNFEDRLDPAHPSLVVTYGNTTRKVRPLDREMLVLGKAAGCDVKLVSPEVANIHCLIVHGTDGWRVRDCGSRVGTRLNGKSVQEAPLDDGDVLQIGSFSFHLNLPGKSAHGTSLRPDTFSSVDDKKVCRLQRSRRNLAERALVLRRRCQELQARANELQRSENLVEERHAELTRQQESLRAQRSELETKAAELLQLEQELNGRFTALQSELADFQDRQEQAEGEMVRRQAEADARLRFIQQREKAVHEAEQGFAIAAAELEQLRVELRKERDEAACADSTPPPAS